MKKILLTLAAIPAATMAVEASAQTSYNTNGEVRIQNRISNLEARLNAGVQAGVIDRRERAVLASRLSELRSLEYQYSMNGMSRSERQVLQQRIRSVRDQLRMAGGNSWANRYGWSDNDLDAYAFGTTGVTYDQFGRPVQTGIVYDQYGRAIANSGMVYDQYGRPVANGYHGQGGPYEPVPQSGLSGVLGSVLGSVVGGNSLGGGGLLGSILGNGGLRTGDVITSTIANALGRGTSYGTQYQDRSNVYFRSDGYRVYEVDARTNRVIAIHPLR